MKNDKRQDVFDWDEVFMQISRVIAKRSKDPITPVGACVVNEKNVIVGLGYNGFPRGCSDDVLPWSRGESVVDSKYSYVVHAEANAIYNSNIDTEGAILYCSLFPCNECAKIIIQNGIKEIVYESDKYHDTEQCEASRKMLSLAGIKCRQYETKNDITFTKKEGGTTK